MILPPMYFNAMLSCQKPVATIKYVYCQGNVLLGVLIEISLTLLVE